MMSNVARDSDRPRDPRRRHVLRSLGVSVVVGAGLAGCLGDDDGEEPDDGSTDSDGDDEPGDETGDEADDDSTDDVDDDDSDPVPVFEVDQLYPVQIDVEHGETFNAAAGISNTGDAEGTQEIGLRIDGDVAASQSLTLEAGANEDVSFREIETEDLETGEHTFGVFTEDDKFTGPLNISGEA